MSVEIDREKFGYLVIHSLDQLGLSVRQVSSITGLSTRQVSYARTGKPIDAGATFLIAKICQIDIETVLPAVARNNLNRIRRVQKSHENIYPDQSVTPQVSRETRACDMPLMQQEQESV